MDENIRIDNHKNTNEFKSKIRYHLRRKLIKLRFRRSSSLCFLLTKLSSSSRIIFTFENH